MIWLDVLQIAINVVLVSLLATDIIQGWRRFANVGERLTRVEEFLRFAKRPP